MNEQDIFASALQNAVLQDLTEYQKLPDHKFSRRFNRRMKKLLNPPQPAIELNGRHISFRRSAVIAMLAILLAALLTGATLAVYKLWASYRIEDNTLFSILCLTDTEGSLRTLEEIYGIGADMSSYDYNTVDQSEYYNIAHYSKMNGEHEIEVIFSQTTKEMYKKVYINTENAEVMPEEILINGYKGVYFETHNNMHDIIFTTDEYAFEILGYGISKDELISIAETVQKTEK